ncbi:MAG TPA: hypothetical protein VE291_05855 [Terracidiphilus sp.]|jgi:hypothetical protein|nr:hypothetical protein [Terracidiphilus sp.]
MPERTIEDRLREEYFDLLPEIRGVAAQLEAELRFRTLPVLHSLRPYEQLIFKSRIKESESALGSLQRRQEGRVFDPQQIYSVTQLPDLAAVRVLVFSGEKLIEVDNILRESDAFRDWVSDPILYSQSSLSVSKYCGYCRDVSVRVRGEYQVVPLLIANFWDVEHAAMYKPTGWAKGIEHDPVMKELRAAVESSLASFEQGFEKFVRSNSAPSSTPSN